MQAKLTFVDRLLALERRVRRVYENWAANQSFSRDLRSFFSAMAEEEEQHLVILERSASLLNFAPVPPPVSDAQIEKIDALISSAEHATEKRDLSAEEALGHALALESSELNQFDQAWLKGFHPDFETLTQMMIPAFEQHFRLLSDAVRRFTSDETLHWQAAALLREIESSV